MAKVSVIVAAYNVEEYITDALNSLVAQTLKDIEIVVVDDCSTDRTLEIIEKFAALDDRIKVVKHEVNKSLMQVRQTGFRSSSGEYIIYLDGDDMLTKDACEKAYKAITSEKVDMLQYDVDVVMLSDVQHKEGKENDMRTYLRSIDHKVVSVSECGMLDEKAVGGKINTSVWNKIYTRALLEKANQHIPDEYLNMAEDIVYSFFIKYYAKSFSSIESRLYRYRYGSGMSTVEKLTERQLASIAKNAYVYNYLKEWAKSKGIEEKCAAVLERTHVQLYTQAFWSYFNRTTSKQRPMFMNEILKYASVDDVVLALSNYVYGGHTNFETLTAEFAGTPLFSSNKTSVKTIATFYYRMFNGGIENVVSSLTDIWVKAGYNVVLFTDLPPHKDDFYINPEVKRVVIPALKSTDYQKQKARVEAFRSALLENNVDMMVYHAWNNPNIVLDEMIVKSCGIKFAVHTHSLFCCDVDCRDPYYAYNNTVFHKWYAFADSVITLNDVDSAWWQMLGKKAIKTVNPNKYTFDIKTAELNGKNILFVGRISWEKRVLDAIRVAKIVHDKFPDATLTIVGSGDDENYVNTVKDYITDNDLGSVVKMAGFTQNVIPYYQSADVILNTSAYEGFSIALTEAKVCGLPLVCYFLPNWDLARDPRGMINVPQGDYEAAAEEVIRLFENDELKKQMGREARQSAEELLGIDLAEHWEKIIAKTLENEDKADGVVIGSPESAAISIAVEKYATGIKLWAERQGEGASWRCDELERTLAEFRRSESYRIGLIVTYIPRKIKALLKKLFGRK